MILTLAFRNLFHDRIDYATNPMTFVGQYVNVDESIAHGAELEFQGKLMSRLTLNSAYTYTSTQNLEAPLCTPANFSTVRAIAVMSASNPSACVAIASSCRTALPTTIGTPKASASAMHRRISFKIRYV